MDTHGYPWILYKRNSRKRRGRHVCARIGRERHVKRMSFRLHDGRGSCKVLFAPWISMDIHGYPWISRDIRGYPWISMDIHRCPRISMGIHGYPLISIDIHGTSMDIHAYPWLCMDIRGYPWMPMDIHGGTCMRPVQSYMTDGAFLLLPLFLLL